MGWTTSWFSGDTTFTFPTAVTNGGLYNVSVFLPPNSQPQSCNPYFFTGDRYGQCIQRHNRLPT